MKTHSSRRKSGFTLVELLVVIAIIAVLAGAGFSAGTAAIQKARKVTALSSAVAIESAVNNFYTEYGTMPVNGLSTDTEIVKTADDTKGKEMLTVLLGYEPTTGANVLNTRSIKFLAVKDGKKKGTGGTGGLITTGTSPNLNVVGLFDPWGGPYQVALDGDYNETITVKPKGAGATSQLLNGRRVAVWSDGADAAEGGAGKAGDDVLTWK